jgi:predicted TPR repeat methyltransferase
MNRKQRRLATKQVKRDQPPPSPGGAATDTVAATLTEGLRRHQAGELAQAEALYRQVLAAQPDNPDAIHLLGTTAYQKGDYEQASSQIEQAMVLRPDDPAFHNNLGNVRNAQGRFEEAAGLFARAIALNPNDAGAHFNLGNAMHKQERLEDAAEHYERTIDLRPDHVSAHNALGNVRKAQGRLGDAAAEYEKALEINPAFAGAHNNLGIIRREQGQLSEAIAHYRKAIDCDAKFALAHVNLAQAFLAQDKLDEAAEHCEIALAIKPVFALAHRCLGNVRRDQRRFDEAVTHTEKAIAIQPDFADAFTYTTLGRVLANMGRREEAAAAFGRALDCDPSDETPRHFLAALMGETTKIAPRRYVKDLFDSHAAAFDRQLVDDLGYNAPAFAFDAVAAVVGDNARFRNTIDLGCGTGLSGLAFRPVSDHLSGVDLSPGMIEEAKQKNVYDAIHEGDVVEFLNKTDDAFDLFVSMDVFVYLGDLTNVFNSMKRKSLDRSYVAFSVERCDGDSYVLRDTGRYAHSPAYIARVAGDHGFDIRLNRPVNLRKQRGKWIPGDIYVLQRRA